MNLSDSAFGGVAHGRDEGQGRRAIATLIAVGAVFSVIVVGLAVVFANASSARRVADNAALLHWTNAAQGSAGIARIATGQAVLFGMGLEADVATEEDLSIAVSEAVASLNSVKRWAQSTPASLTVDSPDLLGLLDQFNESGEAVVAAIQADDFTGAERLRSEEFESIYNELKREIEFVAAIVADMIAANESAAAVIADVTTLVVTLLIPAAAIVAYWLIARRQLRESHVEVTAKLGAQRELIAGVSHELRTPLSAIYGFSELLLAGEVDEESATESIRLINTEAADLSRMVDDLLTAARLDSGQLTFVPTGFSPLEAIQSVAEPFRRAGHDFVLDCEPGSIVTDEIRFRQVVRNLLSNAFRHGGSIVKVVATRNLDGIRLAVMDNGPGLTENAVDRLFEPFANQGNKALLAGSVGLGLSVSRANARMMGGDLTYRRTHGWTEFTLTLAAGMGGVAMAGNAHTTRLLTSPESRAGYVPMAGSGA